MLFVKTKLDAVTLPDNVKDVDHCGALPDEVKTVSAAPIPNFDNVVDADAYNKSPVVKDEFPVPPRPTANVPVHPNVNDAAFSNAVLALPPRVNVTLVSSVFVRAAGAVHCGAAPLLDIYVPDAPMPNFDNAVPLA